MSAVILNEFVIFDLKEGGKRVAYTVNDYIVLLECVHEQMSTTQTSLKEF